MKRTDTKEKIMEAALELFSQKGYTGTSVDEIAESIGIKGPSLYKHFSGKQEIFEALIDYAKETYLSNRLNNPDSYEQIASIDRLKAIVMEQITFTMRDPMTKKMRRLFALEQFRSPKVASIATMCQLTWLEDRYGKIFLKLMEKGILRKQNIEMMTLEFTSPITVLLTLVDREPDKEAYALQRIEQHVDYFLSVYEVYNEGI